MSKLTRKEVLANLGGTPESVADELLAFSESSDVLSSDNPRLLDLYPMNWVGIFDGSVAASDRNFETLMSKLADLHVPASQTIIRFIDTEKKTFIL